MEEKTGMDRTGHFTFSGVCRPHCSSSSTTSILLYSRATSNGDVPFYREK